MENNDVVRAVLEVLALPKVGPVKARSILRECQTAAAIRARANQVFSPTESVAEEARSVASRILGECETLGIGIVALGAREYPRLLSKIKDPPPLLYYRGEQSALLCECVAIVGTREASEDGRRAAREIAKVLAADKFVVVSGLALGIDAAAHEGALEAGGAPTVAILAHGLHMVTPTRNAKLAQSILASGGALVSEHPPGVPPRPPEFVRRNRIQSGMSHCSIVVESGTTGGAIHQARFTVEQGRELFVVVSERAETSLNMEGARHLQDVMKAKALSGTREARLAVREVAQREAPSASSKELFD